MSEQPEPDSGYLLDSSGEGWYRHEGHWHYAHPGPDKSHGIRWERLRAAGPMTPLLPAVRPDGVPDDAVPFVGWVSRHLNGQDYNIHEPDGQVARPPITLGVLNDRGFPVPAAPAPSLPERLREFADQVVGGGAYDGPESSVALLRAAADALEARSQP